MKIASIVLIIIGGAAFFGRMTGYIYLFFFDRHNDYLSQLLFQLPNPLTSGLLLVAGVYLLDRARKHITNLVAPSPQMVATSVAATEKENAKKITGSRIRKYSTIAIFAGIVLAIFFVPLLMFFALPLLGLLWHFFPSLEFSHPDQALSNIILPLSFLTPLGVLVRFLAPFFDTDQSLYLDQDYSFWKLANLLAVVIGFLGILATVMMLSDSPSSNAHLASIGFGLYMFGLVLGSACFVAGLVVGRSNKKAAIWLFEAPFLYGAVGAATFFLLSAFVY